VWTAREVEVDQHAEGLAAQHELDRPLRVLVTARRAREWVLLGERARRWGGPPGLTGRDGTAIAVAAAREGTAEQGTPGGTSAYASGSEEEPLAWQPRGPRTSSAPAISA